MQFLLTLLAIIFFLVLIAVPIVFLRTRTIFREQKNYERGFKIVPLLIHLPPPSEDTEVGSRDERDVTEETISKATSIYNIISSTWQKGFKNTFYGQKHLAFEIVGSAGFVYFYTAVPITMLEIIKQAINSAYPTARIEEVAEHNIFNPVGKISGSIGGELSLKSNFAYPIATYQDIKREPIQPLINALSSLDNEDGAAIQILLRPADPSWRKAANSYASSKRKGKESGVSTGLFDIAKKLPGAFLNPPEHKDDKKDLSSLEQNTYDSIDEKTRYPAFEVLIRVIVSSNISTRANTILQNIIASFSLYDAPGKNGFKYSPAKDIEGLVTAYLMRFFPQQNTSNILNSVELATIFHLPDERSIPTSQIVRQASKQVDGPRNIPTEGLLLGYNVYRGVQKPIRLDLEDRRRHMYIVGQTGTGKSTMLENLALQDMLRGNGFAFVDPHGDSVEKIISMVPKERTEDIIYFNPGDMDYPLGLNIFEFDDPDQKDFIIQETIEMLYKLYDPDHQGIIGPRYEHIFRNAALVVMANPNGGTFIDIPRLLRDQNYVKDQLKYVTDPTVLDFWLKEWPAGQRSNDFGELVNWFISKFSAFLSNDMMRNIIGQTKSSFSLRDIMDNKKILLVNLSKGRVGELNSKLLGMIFVMKTQAAAMSRATIAEDSRVDFSLYVDEFQNFSTESFATIMSEARKYHLNLIVGNQFTTQLTTEIRDAVFGNIGTIISFRIGQNDVESLGQYFQPTFDSNDLLRIPNHNTVVRTLIGGVPTQAFSMATLPPLGHENQKLSVALKQLSSAKFGKPRSVVEAQIKERMSFEPASTSGSQSSSQASPRTVNQFSQSSPNSIGSSFPGQGSQPQMSSRPSVSQPSFLDDWLQKKQNQPAITNSPITRPVSTQTNTMQNYPNAPTAISAAQEQIPTQTSIANNIGHNNTDISNQVQAQTPFQSVGANESKPNSETAPATGYFHVDNSQDKPKTTSSQEVTSPVINDGEDNTEDTIYIDHDGGFHSKTTNK